MLKSCLVAMLAFAGSAVVGYAANNVRSIEAAFGLYKGRTFVSPQIGATIEYLRIEIRPHGEYAIIVRKAD